MSSSVASVPETEKQLPLLFQYTVEAYKAFQKLAELLPNPLAANTFKNLAEDERANRGLLVLRYNDPATSRMKITLPGDFAFHDMLEGDLNNREIAEMLIARERTMERKLSEWASGGPDSDRNLFQYIAGTKRSHIAELERELAMIGSYPDWFRREDAVSLVVQGQPE
jgi:rubrerythrin